MKHHIPFSPNEQLALTKQMASSQRLQRLVETRKQENLRTKSLLNKYKLEIERSLQELSQQSKTQQLEQHQRQLEELKQAVEASWSQIGQAYVDASNYQEKHISKKHEIQQALHQHLEREVERFRVAIAAITEEQQRPQRRHEAQNDRLKQVRQTEKQRASNIAEMFRLTHPENMINAHSQAVPKSVHRQEMKRRADQDNKTLKYDDTYYHKDYAVIRAEPAHKVSENAQPSANRLAEIVLQQIEARQQQTQERNQMMAQRANERSEKALYVVKMEKEQREMMQELQKVQISDRRRKQLLYHDINRQTTIVGLKEAPTAQYNRLAENEHVRQKIMEKFFETKFGRLKEPTVVSKVDFDSSVQDFCDES